ncbi:MAG: hypothetical protein HOP07_02610 [Bacteriovoracaceae bacterium]|nr:hypothetical protein [Bacteriovoracaceae bacterium]
MARISFIFVAILFQSQLFAFEPRSVFQCGRMALIEGRLDEYFILQGIGSFAGPGRPLPVKLSAEKEGNECVISVSTDKFPLAPVRYKFNGDGDPLKGRIPLYALDTNMNGESPTCIIATRYQETLGQCRIPTKDDSRDKCYDLPGRPIHLELKEATFSMWATRDQNIRMDLFSGGVQIKTYQFEENEKIFKSYFLNIWQQNEDWCLHQSETFSDQRGDCSTKLSGNLELRNKEGEIIGLVQKSGNDIFFRQVKSPFSTKGSVVDDSKEILKLSVSGKTITTMSAYTKEGGSLKDGIAKIEGNFEKSGVDFGTIPPFAIGQSITKTSDCNRVTSLKLNTEQPKQTDTSLDTSK